MVDVELAFVEDKIDNPVTDEATAVLAITQPLLELLSLLGVQA